MLAKGWLLGGLTHLAANPYPSYHTAVTLNREKNNYLGEIYEAHLSAQ
jgi:hypothetical protein